jgi:hypothetical protein
MISLIIILQIVHRLVDTKYSVNSKAISLKRKVLYAKVKANKIFLSKFKMITSVKNKGCILS